jgi:hypothetical protein
MTDFKNPTSRAWRVACTFRRNTVTRQRQYLKTTRRNVYWNPVLSSDRQLRAQTQSWQHWTIIKMNTGCM